ncbi:MAG: hypothetical protein PHX45_01925 [Acidobacteriota bacterium]|nr:hypothetical protein [Acidobacteriota bacterium]
MNQKREGMLAPALIGGAAAGFLSGIPFFNCLCCLWIIGGGILAAYLLAKDSPESLKPGDGAIAGILSGIVAAVVNALISVPLHAVHGRVSRRILERLSVFAEEAPSGWEQLFDLSAGPLSVSAFLFGLFISAAVFAIFGALGGIIGVSLFGKKQGPAKEGVPHAPQNPGDRQS